MRMKTLKQAVRKEKIKKVFKKKSLAKRLCKVQPSMESENSTPATNTPKLAEKPKKTGKIQVADRDNVKVTLESTLNSRCK